MPEQNKKSDAKARVIQAYPSPKYHKLVVALSERDEISRSEVANIAIKEYFDKMPEEQKQHILNSGKNHY